VLVTTVKQSVSFVATFTIPTTGVPTSGSTDFNAAYYGYGAATLAGTYLNNTWTLTPGFTLVAGSSRRGTAVVFATTVTTCATAPCTATVATAGQANNALAAAQSPGLAASVVSNAALVGGYVMASPTVFAPITVVQSGDSGKTAVVGKTAVIEVIAFATAVIAMVIRDTC